MKTYELQHSGLSEIQAANCEEGVALINRVLDAAEASGLYEVLGAELYAGDDLRGRLLHLQNLTNHHMDWRNGKERDSTERPDLPEGLERTLRALGADMGMTTPCIPEGPADFVFVLGSFKPSVLERADLAAAVLDRQRELHPERKPVVAGLSSKRRCRDGDAMDPAIDYAPTARNEIEFVYAALKRRFDPEGHVRPTIFRDLRHDRYEYPAWEVGHYEAPDGTDVVVIAAPPVEGRGRADTADTYRFAAQFFGREVLLGRTVVLATASIYAPYMHMSALRLLGMPYEMNVRMAQYVAPEFLEPYRIGIEFNAAVNHAVMLLDALTQYSSSPGRPAVIM